MVDFLLVLIELFSQFLAVRSFDIVCTALLFSQACLYILFVRISSPCVVLLTVFTTRRTYASVVLGVGNLSVCPSVRLPRFSCTIDEYRYHHSEKHQLRIYLGRRDICAQTSLCVLYPRTGENRLNATVCLSVTRVLCDTRRSAIADGTAHCVCNAP